MARFVEINFHPEVRALRTFGFVGLGGFALLALLAAREKAIFAFGLGGARLPVTVALAVLAGYSLVASLVWPRANWPVYVGLSLISFPIGFVLSYLLIGVLFFLVIGPVALVMRIAGHDPMNRRYQREARSYWAQPPPKESNDRYFRQF